MATNNPGRIPRVMRVVVSVANETSVTFPGAVSIVALQVQCIDSIDCRFSFDPGGTFSADNFFTIKSGESWIERDVNWVQSDNLVWFRIPTSPNGDSVIEIIYWSA